MICFILALTVLVCWSDLNSNLILFCFHQLTVNGNQPLQREEILKLLCALETKLPMEIAKPVMLLPSIKSSMKYHFPEEIHATWGILEKC